MNITGIEVHLLGGPGEERPHWVSHFPVPAANELLVVLHTAEGISGFGLGSSNASLEQTARMFTDGLGDFIVGADALAPERLYRDLMSITWRSLAAEKGWSKPQLVLAAAAVDIACWDIVGKQAGLPLYRLFGGYRDRVPCYVTCAYYREGKDLGELREEMQMLESQGHTAFKAKIGALGLEEDMQRLQVIREVIGDDAELMVDVNCGWDLATALEAVKRLPEVNPRWLEEPVHWYDDRRLLKLLAQNTDIPLSAGESEQSAHGCRALLEEQAISVLQFDCTRMGGFTMGRKLAALAELNHVDVAPHHDCFLHAHLVAASPAGLIVESFTDPERDPLQAELFEDPPRIEDGILYLKDAPGLGLELRQDTIEKYGRRII
ncbi:MAG: mandelate racemase/muconate lactonizing enzyme family protein [Gammaproteobacteria bacterium]|jgi:D-galactarolactone cycloisomerase